MTTKEETTLLGGDASASSSHVKPAAEDSRKQKDGKSIRPRRHRAGNKRDFKTQTLQIRVSANLKSEADRTLAALGISLPEAVRVFLGRVVREQAIPFCLESPNPRTAAGLRDSIAADHQRFTSAELFHALGDGESE